MAFFFFLFLSSPVLSPASIEDDAKSFLSKAVKGFESWEAYQFESSVVQQNVRGATTTDMPRIRVKGLGHSSQNILHLRDGELEIYRHKGKMIFRENRKAEWDTYGFGDSGRRSDLKRFTWYNVVFGPHHIFPLIASEATDLRYRALPSEENESKPGYEVSGNLSRKAVVRILGAGPYQKSNDPFRAEGSFVLTQHQDGSMTLKFSALREVKNVRVSERFTQWTYRLVEAEPGQEIPAGIRQKMNGR